MSETIESSFNEEKEKAALAILKRVGKKDATALADFFELFSDDIYNFPMRVFRLSEDDSGDFYLYAFEHLKDGRRLNSFQGKSRFTTWFFSVLRNLVIDFLRTKRNNLQMSSLAWTDMQVAGGVQPDEIDLDDSGKIRNEIFERFENELSSLKISQRVLIKLAYIHFLEFSNEEFEFLCETSKLSRSEAETKLAELRDMGHERAVKVRDLEEKLTANFQSILALENRLNVFFREHPDLPNEKEKWHEEYTATGLPIHIIDTIRSFAKKKKRQSSLLEKQQRSLLSIRIPYKELSSLLQSSQGVISVQLVRIIEKITRTLA